ncbi:hypothetical protein P153DRAFT_297855, partial [Dothidotthia symphoricarpi CBS 119687]
RHHECPACDFDGESWEDLLQHCRQTSCREVCQGCDDGSGSLWGSNSDGYWEHVDDHNVCTQCERHFGTPDNLFQHELTHRAANYECFYCPQMFKTYGGMAGFPGTSIIHAERGVCSNSDRIDLYMLAAECHRWRAFIDQDYHSEMLGGWDLEYRYGKVDPFHCPECGIRLPQLSSLFQHIESNSCDQTLNDGAIGQLRNFLWNRLTQ